MKILAINDVSTSVCRTRVARSLWKTVSHTSSTSSVKGKLGGQAWLTQVPCLVRQGPEECNQLDVLGGQAWLTRVPCLVRLAFRGVVDTRSGKISLGGSW